MIGPEAELLDQFLGELKTKYGPVSRVLLVQVPQFDLAALNQEVARNRGYYAFPPTGLQFIYQALEGRGLDIRILDLNLAFLKRLMEDESWSPDRWPAILEESLAGFQPQLVGVGCMYDVSIKALLRVLSLLKARDESIVVAGGLIPTFEWRRLLDDDLCHLVVRGEGEPKIAYLLDRLGEMNQGARMAAGIAFRRDGEFIGGDQEADRAEMEGDLIASYAQVKVEDYHRCGSLNPYSRLAGRDDHPYAAIQFSRGCRGRCTFCAVRSIAGRKVRYRPVDDLLAEIEYLVKQRGVRHIEWLDDDLLFNRRLVQDLLRRIVDKGLKITWSANNGLIAASLDEKTLELFRDSGCIGFRVGIESGNPEILKKIKKPGTLADFRRLARLVDNYPEIFVGGNFILGLPGETFGQMMDSFRLALELNLDWSPFAILQPVRGASAFVEFQDYFEEQFKDGGKVTTLVPTRASSRGVLEHSREVRSGYQIFGLSSAEVPDPEQVKEIWFTFNLLVNYLYNKNLTSPERADKFISWVAVAQVAHPPNGYMSLFLALGHQLAGSKAKAEEYLALARRLSEQPYWHQRFDSFHLTRLLDEFPRNEAEVRAAVEELRADARAKAGGLW